jgi:hypothetical protein
MIAEALALGFTVLHTDLDMFFLENPMPVLRETRGELVTLWDDAIYNAGFVLVRPTVYGKEIDKKMDKYTKKTPSMDDQQAMNKAVRSLKGKKNFKAVALDMHKFLCGLGYWEKGKRLFPTPCAECIVVHNNWIVSREAKIYRFKEHLMWAVNDNQYYSSPSRKYLAYDNPVNAGKEAANRDHEGKALQTALAIGQVLDRVVILPKFHCGKDGKQDGPLNSLLPITPFDAQFEYREHSFLTHPLVPKHSETPRAILLDSPTSRSILKNTQLNEVVNRTLENDAVASSDLMHWLGGKEEGVLRFHSLYGLNVQFANSTNTTIFTKKIKDGFVKGTYRQL